MTTAVISAMQSEIRIIEQALAERECRDIPGMKIYTGTVGGNNAVLAVSGEGKVNAAACAEAVIMIYRPDLIICTGIAGGTAKGMNPGDIVIADKTVQHDFDASPLGYEKGRICNLDTAYFPCDAAASDILYRIAGSNTYGFKVHRGTVASGDTFINNTHTAASISDTFGACAVDMETAALAQVCYINNVPFAALRVISDNGDNSAFSDYGKFEKYAADIAAETVKSYFSEIRE